MGDIRVPYLVGEREMGSRIRREGVLGRWITTRIPTWVDHPTAGDLLKREFSPDAYQPGPGMEEPSA